MTVDTNIRYCEDLMDITDLEKPVRSLDLSVSTHYLLIQHGIKTIHELTIAIGDVNIRDELSKKGAYQEILEALRKKSKVVNEPSNTTQKPKTSQILGNFDIEELRNFPLFSDSELNCPETYREQYNIPIEYLLNQHLPVRGNRVIHELGVANLFDLLMIKKSRFLSQKNIGITTYNKITRSIIRCIKKPYNDADNQKYPTPIKFQSGLIEKYDYRFFNSQSPICDNDRYNIPISIILYDLSVRSDNAINNLKVSTLLELLNTNITKFMSTKNVGRKTYFEIKQKMQIFIEAHPRLFEKKDKVLTFDIASPDNYLALFESTLDLRDGSVIDLSRLIHLKINSLHITAGDIAALHSLGIHNIYSLINTSRDVLQKSSSLNNKSLNRIIAEAKLFVSSLIYINADFFEDRCQYIAGLHKYVYEAIDRQMNLLRTKQRKDFTKRWDCFRKRCGLGVEPMTLEMIGREFKCTRERIRQIECKFKEYLFNSLPYAYKTFIYSTLDDLSRNGGILSLRSSEACTSVESLRLFICMMEHVNPPIRSDNDYQYIFSMSEEMFDAISTHLETALSKGEGYEECDIDRVLNSYALANNIGSVDVNPFITYAKGRWFRIINGLYYHGRKTKLATLEEFIKKHFKRGIFIYKQIDDIRSLATEMGCTELVNISDARLRGMVSISDKLILWDWGKYIHIDNLDTSNIDNKLFHSINEWLIDKICSKRIPKVSLWGAYSLYERECVDAGIPNEHALYSVMKLKYCDKYSFLKDPYVYPLDSLSQISGVSMVEGYIYDKYEAVNKEVLCGELGLKEYQLNAALDNSTRIINLGDGCFIHVDNFKINESFIKNVDDYLNGLLAKYVHVSVKHVYENKIVMCKVNNISSARSLYYILAHLLGDRYLFATYPHILSRDHGIEDDGRVSLNDMVENYFAKNNKVVYLSEVQDYFVKKRGYLKSRIDNIHYLCENVVRYAKGSYISLSAINWSEDKQHSLNVVAYELFKNNCLIGVPFASLNDLLEKRLPAISETVDVSWQKVLLRDLLDRNDSVRLIGASKDLYIVVPNEFSIDSQNDLIGYILKKDYGGAANKDLFLKRLSELDITRSLSDGDYAEGNIRYKVFNEEVFII